MSAKSRWPSRSKGVRSVSEPHGAAGSTKSTSEHQQRRRPSLKIITPSYQSNFVNHPSTTSASQSAVRIHSASNLLAIFKDKLHSPIASPTVYPRSSSNALLDKPLPSQPRSKSPPPTPEPAELPGSILLENQGFPSPPPAPDWATFPTMRSVRSGNSLSPTPRPGPPRRAQHKKSLSEANLPTNRSKFRSGPATTTSSTDRSTDSRMPTCSESTIEDYNSSSDTVKAHVGLDALLRPSPLMINGKTRKGVGGGTLDGPRYPPGGPSTHTPPSTNPAHSTPSKQVEELKATITAQDQTISTLQAQFASLRGSHEAHIASLVDAHAAEIASLRNYTRALEEQQKQRTLHHASSNHLLFVLDTTDPHSVNSEPSRASTGSASATSYRSFETALEQQTRTKPLRSRDAPEMERFKQKLNSTRRAPVKPVSSRNPSREPSVQSTRPVPQETVAQGSNAKAVEAQLERVLESLKATKESEEKYMRLLEDAERACTEYRKKASKNEQLEKNIVALQNTVDHLEYRLQLANIEKVDLAEKLHNLQTQSTPFDPKRPRVQVPSSLLGNRESVDTVFTDRSPITPNEVSEMRTTLTAFIDHIERLQDQIREKDTHISELNTKHALTATKYDELAAEYRKLSLQSDIQGQLLLKTKQDEIHIDELRNVILKREAIIGEKNKALEQAERQLDCHKSLLEAEVKRYAALKLSGEWKDDALPDPTSLVSKEEIDRWIDRLQQHLKTKKSKKHDGATETNLEETVRDLREEIEFYIREIIYYKLDVRGYKSDIRKLKRLAGVSGRNSRSGDAISTDSALAPAPDSPVHPGCPASPPDHDLAISLTPIIADSVSVNMPVHPATPARSPEGERDTPKRSRKNKPLELDLKRPMTPPNLNSSSFDKEADSMDPGISPRSNKKLSPERRKPTPPSPTQEKFGDLATNFPLSTPASPKRHAVKMKPDSQLNDASGDQVKDRAIPERPPRPRLGLFESPIGNGTTAGAGANAPRKDVMAEAMQQAPERRASHTSDPSPSRPSTANTTKADFYRPGNLTTAPFNPATQRPRTSSSINSPAVGMGFGMGSPHNRSHIAHPLVAPATTPLQSASCSITRNVKVLSPTLRTGVGGTMASTTPTNSPVSPTSYFPPISTSSPPSRNASAGSAKGSKSEKVSSFTSPIVASFSRSRSNTAPAATTQGLSRTMSGSSSSTLRQAMNLPAKLDFMKGKGKPRKESIGTPTLLASPFDIDRSSTTGEGAVENVDVGIGKAV